MKKASQLLLLWLGILCCNLDLQAQVRKNVSGSVRDDKGQPLAGATISEKGTTNSVFTADNGTFTISVAQNARLIISFIGYPSVEVGTSNPGDLAITLTGSDKSLDEVVVTSLGISKKEKALGYSVSTISADKLTESGSPNFATALYGKAPGVRIGATPGGATSAVNINIRGINSITGKNQPLIVLDGVPIREGEVNNGNYWGDQRLRGNGLLDINPEDIENVSILKGASAAALYGSEAVNGVVLITTKSGKGKKGFNVDVSTNYSQDNVAFLPNYQNRRGPGAPLIVNNGGQDAEGFIYYDVDGDGVKETRGVLGYSINFGPEFDGKPTMAWDGKIRPYEAQKDNYKGLFRTAHNSNATVAMSHASENSNVRFSMTRQNNQGVSLGADNTKNIANLNGSFRLGKKWTTDIMINYINQETKNRPYSIDRLMNNFTGMIGRFEHAQWYLDKYKTSKGYRFVTGSGQSLTPEENIIRNGFKGDLGDYVWRVKEHRETEKSNRVIASLTNHWQILKDLRLRARLSTDFTSMRTEARQTTERPLAFGYSGGFSLSNYTSSILYGDLLLTYSKQINENLELSVMGGYTATNENGTTVSRGTDGGLSTENLFDIAASVNTPWSGSSRYSIVKDAFIGTVNANYKSMLFVEGTVRRDRTSTMNPNNNSFVYPSVNSSLVLSELFNLPKAIDFAKIRASWGIVGNYPDLYRANIAYDQNTLGVQAVGGQPILYTTLPSNFGNDNIRPEEKHEIEFGLQVSMYDKRLGFDISYYNGQIRDQILPLTIPASSGATSVLTNIGTLRNKGVEIGITSNPVRSRNFRWDAGINFAFNRNVVEKLANGSSELLHADYDGNAAQLKSVVGQPMGDFYAHPVATDEKGQKIVDPNGLYKVDPNKMVKIGNAMPKVTGGIFNTISFKGFTLDAMIDFRYGGYVMPTAINWMISRGLLEESTQFMDKESGGLSYYQDASGKRFLTSANAGPNGEKVYNDGMVLDGVKADGTKNDYITSSANYFWTVYNWGGPQYSPNTRYELYIKENSYVKFRELSIAYAIPGKISAKIGANKIQLSVFGRNLFYIYRTLKHIDAEQTTAGSRWFQSLTNVGTNPSTRTIGIMLRASF
ncbi:SusC/RagA family TonB-linked outer membrane protein [Flavihumibacter sp. CACIAM 22H1]|uniref:SusC/RagA family TonB-linked outer membrane protein n=1 Tax=Flavihumibacter sp. CACIAM 22H1 TaxID=1812911 RepID=UPI0007A8B651|nr:SusC/RagA family TonB-linked outer membrane protein [Flavihumibacter sp. CACIAM 22H1]KYP14454.1 MAG: SusC/RagA family protein [Flavihumibacter sp. CACIAM 22H1]